MSDQTLVDRLTAELQPFMDLRCVGGKLYLGSMFYLDFGGTFSGQSRTGKPIEIGEMTLSIRDVAWWLYRGDDVALAAESVSGEQFEQTISGLLGTCITGFQHQTAEGRLQVRLGQQWRVVVDLTNQWQTDNDILEIAIPDGRLFTIDRRGELLAAPGWDAERARNWSRSSRRN